MTDFMKWNEMGRELRSVVMSHYLAIAEEEKKFDDELGVFLRKEYRRLNDLKRYNGAVPLLFKDHFDISFNIVTVKHIQCVTASMNRYNKSDLTTTALLLCQAKFCFDEKKLDDMQFYKIVDIYRSIGERDLLNGMVIYTRPFKMPEKLKTCF